MPGWAKGNAVNVTATSQLLRSGGWRKTGDLTILRQGQRDTDDTLKSLCNFGPSNRGLLPC